MRLWRLPTLCQQQAQHRFSLAASTTSLEICRQLARFHYGDVIMGTMASQFTSLTIVYSTFYSGVDQRKHQSPTSLAFVRGIPRTNGQLRGKCFHFITSSCDTIQRFDLNSGYSFIQCYLVANFPVCNQYRCIFPFTTRTYIPIADCVGS